MLAMMELPKLIEPIIRQAGSILLSFYGKPLHITDKTKGFVTDADIASERYLIAELSKILPKASFFAEESGKSGSNEYCWVIDPLDGTTNFAHQLNYFCISIALTHNDKPIFGMIFQPVTNELFFAVQGQGSYANHQRMHVSDQIDLKKSLICVGFPYSKGKEFMETFDRLKQLMPYIYAYRQMGAIALDLAYVAAGRAEGIIFKDLEWWDCAAGVILLQEAGALVTDYQGNPVGPNYTSFIAANPEIYNQLISFV